jgi:hypothetical protein
MQRAAIRSTYQITQREIRPSPVTSLESKVLLGTETYTVAHLLKNMRNAFSKDEAMRWGFCIQRAFLEFGFNPDIGKTMDQILKSKDVPPVLAIIEEKNNNDVGMPPTLINIIFRTEFDQEQLKNLWRWIKEHSIDEISYPYQYFSLLLFLENHHSTFLEKSHLSNSDMQAQMANWFPEVKIKCSADAIGTYRNGYFTGDAFKYTSWLNSTGEPPIRYEYKKDQGISGFIALNKLCNNLELYLSELKI